MLALDTDLDDADGDGYYPENECGIMGDKDAFDCDDSVYVFTPEGSYVFRKLIDRGGSIGEIVGDYDVEISADDVNGNFIGTGTRDLTDPIRTAYVNITGTI
jgi:hypothetical protein